MNLRLVMFCVCVPACFSQMAAAQAPPVVNATYPAAVTPGKPTDITLYGANLQGSVGAWLSFGGQIEVAPGIEGNGTKTDQVTYRITVPAETPAQTGGIRVATAGGISNLRLLMIDDLATVADNGTNKTMESAQELHLPVAVDGTCEPESFDFYKFQAHGGQRISVEVFARRLGFALDPVIRLLDSAGHELAYSDDEGGLSGDSRFTHQFAADGQYLLEIRDIRYQGGGGHRYRLRVGDFPLVTVPMPMGAQKGAMAKLEAAGPAVARAPRIEFNVPENPPGQTVAVAFKYPDGQGSGMATLRASGLGEQVEFEPNGAAEQASRITLPGAVTGRFGSPRDRDFYQFDAVAGQRFLFIGRTRKVGSPTDLFMQLFKADGGLLAEAEDNGTDEGMINYTFAEAGTYRLVVEDLHRRGGPEFGYRIEALPYRPGFELALESDKFDVPRGGIFAAKVTSRRFDYNGPITLSLVNGEGFTLANNVIAEGQNEVVLQATAAANLEPGNWRIAGIEGKAKIGDSDFIARAETAAALKAQFNGFPFPPEALNGLVGLGIGPVFPDFFKLSVPTGNVVRFPQLVGTSTVTVKVEKLNGFNDAIALTVHGLPPEFAVETKPIEKDKAEAQIVIKGPPTLSESDYRFRIVGSATFQNQPKSVLVDQLQLRVTPPLAVTIEIPGPVKAGERLKAKIRAQRDSDDKSPIAIAWRNLPLGVTAPEGTSIPEGQNEIEVELATAANAMVGPAANVQVVANTKVQGRDISVESALATLQVTMP